MQKKEEDQKNYQNSNSLKDRKKMISVMKITNQKEKNKKMREKSKYKGLNNNKNNYSNSSSKWKSNNKIYHNNQKKSNKSSSNTNKIKKVKT